MKKRKIDIEYFNQIKNSGHTVPRDKKTGNVLSFAVGKHFEITNNENDEVLKVVCTQDCPTSLKLLTI